MGPLRIGTSSFTAQGWGTAFYPAGLKDIDRLSYYATKFDTVEIDATFYHSPARATVRGWYARTPPGFRFALKVPQSITHEKVLLDCKVELQLFLDAVSELKEKLGPLLLQFGYFNQNTFRSQSEFLMRLKPFVESLPKDLQFVCEIRNKGWVDARFLDLLRQHNVGFALIDQSWMPRAWEMSKELDLLTAQNLAYVRLLGDRQGIETITKVWDKVVVDRASDLRSWVAYCRPIVSRGTTVWAYVNNHYAGFAPGTAESFLHLWNADDRWRSDASGGT